MRPSPHDGSKKIPRRREVEGDKENIFYNTKGGKKQDYKLRNKEMKEALDKLEWKDGNLPMCEKAVEFKGN